MKAFVDKLHANGQRWVPILDPVIHVRKGYKPYDDGMRAGVFLNDQTGHPYVAQLWPGASHLPDFMHPNASSWWQEQLRSVIDEEGLGIDGIWLDMNEVREPFFLKEKSREGSRSKREKISTFFKTKQKTPSKVSNYCTGDVCRATSPVLPNNKFVCELQCEDGPHALNRTLASPVPPLGIYNPPYAINNGGSESSLGAKTLPSSAVHHGGVFEYNVHNLYAHFQTMATASALQKLRDNKRQFIFTRSSFVGTGAYSAHWTGDTLSSWDDLRASLPMIFQSGIAGIPFVGAGEKIFCPRFFFTFLFFSSTSYSLFSLKKNFKIRKTSADS
jgi:alpha-glucosidase (family GH31 glycosyl hydrolase)